MRVKNTEKERAVAMRKQGKTYSEIRKEVPVAKSTISLWLRDVGLAKSQQQRITAKRHAAQQKGAEARRRERVRSTGQIHKEAQQEIGALSKRELMLIGTALYWAEGSKQHEHLPSVGVIFSNSDVVMHRVFLRWLSALGVSMANLTFELYVHKNRKDEVASFRNWWARELRIPIDQLHKIYFKLGNPKTLRRNTGTLYHGLLRIKVKSSTALNRRISGWIEGISAA